MWKEWLERDYIWAPKDQLHLLYLIIVLWAHVLNNKLRGYYLMNRMEIMKRYHPFSRQENLQDLEKTAVAFEENIFTAATSQSHYLRKISLKMLSLEMNPILNSLQSNAASNSRNPVPVEAAGTEGSDWRVGLQRSSRQRIANKIMEILRRHLPFSGEDGLEEEIKIMAVRFEENVYSAAFNQSDYLRKISLKMLTLATKIPEVCSEFSSV